MKEGGGGGGGGGVGGVVAREDREAGMEWGGGKVGGVGGGPECHVHRCLPSRPCGPRRAGRSSARGTLDSGQCSGNSGQWTGNNGHTVVEQCQVEGQACNLRTNI